MKAWEAIALSLNVEPREVRTNPNGWMAGGSGHFMHLEGNSFEDRLEVLRRNLSSFNLVSIVMGQPDHCQIRTGDFVTWAKGLGWSMPPEVEAIAPPTPASPQAAPSVDLSTAERNSLLKLVIGMAVQGYRYDPRALKSSTAAEIASDLTELGIGLDADTVRKYLREGATLLPGDSQSGKTEKR